MSAWEFLAAACRWTTALLLAAASLTPLPAWAEGRPAPGASASVPARRAAQTSAQDLDRQHPGVEEAAVTPAITDETHVSTAAAIVGVHSRRIDEIRHHAEALLGPLPAVASTPFFGLAMLTAAGLAAKSDLIQGSASPWVRAFRDSVLIRQSQRYATWPAFLTLAGLALVTYLANTGKVRGIGGKLLRIVEDGSSALLYFAFSLGALEIAAPSTHTVAVIHLGTFDGAVQHLAALGLALGLAAMMIVRHACDVLIWLTPVPFIDFAFETVKKLLTVCFLCLYLFAPVVAAAIALVLLVAAFLTAPWAVRVLSFTFHILIRPLLSRLLPPLRPRLLDPNLVARHAPDRTARLAADTALSKARTPGDREPAEIGGILIATHAFALSLDGVRRRSRGVLLATAHEIFFSHTTALGRRRAWSLSSGAVPGVPSPCLVRAILWIELRPGTASGACPGIRIALPRTFDLTRLRLLLHAAEGQPPPASAGAAPIIAGLEPANHPS